MVWEFSNVPNVVYEVRIQKKREMRREKSED